MEPSKSDPTSANKPETNVPLTGTHSAEPGKALDAGDLGNLNSRVVAPYGHELILEPSKQPSQSEHLSRVAPKTQPAAKQSPPKPPVANTGPAKQPEQGAAHNARPSVPSSQAAPRVVNRNVPQAAPKQDATKDSQSYANRENYPDATESKLAPKQKEVSENSPPTAEGVVKHESEG